MFLEMTSCVYFLMIWNVLSDWGNVYDTVSSSNVKGFVNYLLVEVPKACYSNQNEYERIVEHPCLQYCSIKCRTLKVCNTWLYFSYCDLSFCSSVVGTSCNIS